MQFTISETVHSADPAPFNVVVQGAQLCVFQTDGDVSASCVIRASEAGWLPETDEPCVVLGHLDTLTSVLAEDSPSLNLSSAGQVILHTLAADTVLPKPYAWRSLRELFTVLPEHEFAMASRALQLHNWQTQHKFCGVCGAPSVVSSEDRAMVCSACAHRMYPRISPCVIGVVRKGSQLLLAHGVNSRSGIYSALAGFIEPGEDAESAFCREVFEEVGISIANVRYICSQSWPFPGQLMLGFIADYDSGELKLDEKEIVDAAWFSVDNLPALPPAYTISGQLIQHVLTTLD